MVRPLPRGAAGHRRGFAAISHLASCQGRRRPRPRAGAQLPRQALAHAGLAARWARSRPPGAPHASERHRGGPGCGMSAPPSVAEVLAQIDAALRPLADAQLAPPMLAYMLDQFAFLGIRATPRRQALRSLPSLKGWDASALLALADALWDQPEREFQYVAVDLLSKHHRQLGVDALPRILQLVQRKPWWDTVDGLAGVVGDILLRERAVQPQVQERMDTCINHAHLWVRRVAMLHQLGWREQTDEARLLRYALT